MTGSSAQPVALILVVGLTPSVLGDHTPRLRSFARAGGQAEIVPILPAVTCSVQSSMLTGLAPGPIRDGDEGHEIVGNGWFDRTLNEVHFWKQSNRLVRGERLWDAMKRRDPAATTANMFWWFNMYSGVEYSVTPRPIYKADGRKIPDCYSCPADLRDFLQSELGPFPLFRFWGPGASIQSTQWIAEATRLVVEKHAPTLTLVYLPHLDYAHQRSGPFTPAARAAEAELDQVFGKLVDFFDRRGIEPIVVSEYGIEPVHAAVPINRVLREAGFLSLRREQGAELLDPGASAAFAIADHQVAHVYCRDNSLIAPVSRVVESTPGVECCLHGEERRRAGLAAARAGEIVAVAQPGCWFEYGWWKDDRAAPDFARTVDIHRKPGYDPLELFIDPRFHVPKLAIASRLLRRKLGFRTLLDVIPLDSSLVMGSHGRVLVSSEHRPIILVRHPNQLRASSVPCTDVKSLVLERLFRA